MSSLKTNAHAKLTFHGAALEVTGSCHLIEANGVRILLDCGLHQGGSAARKANRTGFDFNPSSIDIVVLSHAHLDHSGALPRLVNAGFSGAIYCTEGTAELLPILLRDAFHLYERDIQFQNKKRARQGREPVELLYSVKDIDMVLSLLRAYKYEVVHKIASNIRLNFFNAGHILGSSIVELEVIKDGSVKKIVFSGDLGNDDTPLMPEPAIVTEADLVLLESTYGDRNHKNQTDTLTEFKSIIDQAANENGNIMIPAFALGRTQELLFHLGCLYQQGHLNGWRVFLDSPMATSVTTVYDRFIERLDRKDTSLMKSYGSRSLKEFLPILTISESVEDSMLINETKSKAIIIAGSGMCTGGRIRHHFKQRIWQKNAHIIFVGFQAEGTFGRKLLSNPRTVKFFGQEFVLNATIHTIGGFSAHAGQDELIAWAKQFEGEPKFCLVHGERKAVVELHEQLLQRAGINAEIAVKGASIYL